MFLRTKAEYSTWKPSESKRKIPYFSAAFFRTFVRPSFRFFMKCMLPVGNPYRKMSAETAKRPWALWPERKNTTARTG